jgi:hypothetical protein
MTPPSLDTFPGWRADPETPGRERFWNGIAWTDKVRVASAARSTSDVRIGSGARSPADDPPTREITTADGVVILAQSSAPVRPGERRVPPDPAGEPAVTLESAPPPIGQPPLRIGAITPDSDPVRRPDIVELSTSESRANGRSIFVSESDAAPVEAARSVRRPAAPPQRSARPTLWRWLVPFLCLLTAAAAGFAVGYLVADPGADTAPLQVPAD